MTEHDTRDDIVVSFKPHTGYDSPLIAVKGRDAAEVADKLGAVEATGLFAIIAGADQAFKAAYNLGAELGATPVTHPQTAQQQYHQAGGYNGQQAAGYPAQQAPQAAGYGAQPQGTGYPAQQAPAAQAGYGGGQQAYQGGPPRGPAPTPPGLVAPNCPHGVKNYVEGQYGPFWGCPARRDDPSKCRPEKIRT